MNTTHLFKNKNLFDVSPEDRARQKAAFDRAHKKTRDMLKANETWNRISWPVTNLERADLEKRTLGQIEVTADNKMAFDLISKWTPDKTYGFMLYGKVGSGKTHLLKGLMIKWALHDTHIRGRFFSLTDLMGKFRENLENLQAFKHQLSLADILVIDDFGAEKTTEFVQTELLSFIDRRINQGKSVFVTSNYSPTELKTRYDVRILDRMQELMTFCEVKGDSYRRKIFSANRNDAMDSIK